MFFDGHKGNPQDACLSCIEAILQAFRGCFGRGNSSAPLLKLKYSSAISDAFTDLDSPEMVRKAFVGFQQYQG
jgi:hypothetical protein